MMFHAFAVAAVAAAAQAGVVEYTFTATVDFGSLVGRSFSGSIRFDDTGLSNIGTERRDTTNGLELSFSFEGQSYTQANDIGPSPDFPFIELTDGVVTGLNWAISDPSAPLIPFLSFGAENNPEAAGNRFAFGTFFSGSGEGFVTFTLVPAPAASAAFAIAGLFAGRRRR